MTHFNAVSRRTAILALSAFGIAGQNSQAAEPRSITVYKTPSCGCCKNWVTHLEQGGFKPTIEEFEDLTPIRARFGIPTHLAACHTGFIQGYVIEGHVPASDIAQLLKTKPRALGLVVPGMPPGSPGMEVPGGNKEPYNTLLLVDRSGKTRVFAKHG